MMFGPKALQGLLHQGCSSIFQVLSSWGLLKRLRTAAPGNMYAVLLGRWSRS